MINPRELRIGNLVYWDIPQKKYVPHVVTMIKENNINTTPISLGDSLNEYSPIPITTEWLIKLGFIPDTFRGNYWINRLEHYIELIESNGDYFPTWVEVPELSSVEEQRTSINKINYIHQLQNLFFALTGEELVKD